MIYIDGSYGEGGGQILRSSLSLAAITGKPINIYNIRAGRKKPGLAAQHLTSVRAAAAICNAEVRGDALGSMVLEFVPGSAVQAGSYTFDVSEAREGGSDGAVGLVLQTVLLPLVLAIECRNITGECRNVIGECRDVIGECRDVTCNVSTVVLRGGTHVSHSPSITYIEKVYLPMLRRMGVEAEVKLNGWGWYPQGGGEVELLVKSNTSSLGGITLMERGELQQVQGLAVVTELPSHIPQRMVNRADKVLREAGFKASIKPLRAKGVAPGAGLFITAEYENSLAGFGGLGRLGLRAEKVADMACEEFLQFHQSNAPVDEHLADQLLLATALASEVSEYKVAKVSQHLMTNVWAIEQFGLARVMVDEGEKVVKVEP